MKCKANVRSVVIFVLLLVLVAVAGCQRADLEQAAAVDETESKDNPATTVATKAEATSSEERGAEARAGDGAVAVPQPESLAPWPEFHAGI